MSNQNQNGKVNWHAVSAIVLAVTAVVVGWQAYETNRSVNEIARSANEMKRSVDEAKRSTDIIRSNITIQNRPYIILEKFVFRYNEEKKFIDVYGIGECSGKTAAHNYRPIKFLLFYITFSKNQLIYLKALEDREREKVERHFYVKGIVDNILNHIEKNPNIDKVNLDIFLTEMKSNPRRIRNKALGPIDILLKFDGFQVYEEGKEWEEPPIVKAPESGIFFYQGKSENKNPIPDILENEKVLFVYWVQEYEGINEGEKFTSSFFGYIDGQRAKKGSIGKIDSITRDKKGEELEVYIFETYKTWTTRFKIPK